jgi:hypothetical protein
VTNLEYIEKLKDIATNHKTLYVMGCFGAPMNTANKKRYTSNHDYNKKPARTMMINAASSDTFGFDCVCLLKGVLWGWSGDKNHVYGGAKYATNGVPDVDADGFIRLCKNVSTDFKKLEVGEILWLKGHVGVYIGDGMAVECTPSWKNRVQITPVLNFGTENGKNGHKWTKHGKLPYIEYVRAEKTRSEEIAEYIEVLRKEGVISEPLKWQKKAEADMDIYWLLKKTSAKF